MQPIPLTSCNACDPDRWKVIKEAVGYYRCNNCHKPVNVVLEKRKEK